MVFMLNWISINTLFISLPLLLCASVANALFSLCGYFFFASTARR